MKGIREISMSPEPDKPEMHYPAPLYPKTYKPHQDSSLFDYDNYPIKKYTKPTQNLIEIKLTIDASDLGPVADETATQYDWNAAQNKAQEIAYDRIEELLGHGFEGKFSLEFNVYDDGESYEVSVVLTPTK